MIAEFALQFLQLRDVHRDADGLHPGQRGLHRQLHLAEQGRGVDRRELRIECIGEVGDRPSTQDQGLHRLVVDAFGVIEERKLLLLRGFSAKLTPQVAQ